MPLSVFFRVERVHVATRILYTKGLSSMSSFHFVSSRQAHRLNCDDRPTPSIHRTRLPQVGTPFIQLVPGMAPMGAAARIYASLYSDCASLNKRASHAPHEFDGANEWTRTTDLLFTKQLLCRLSYVGSPFQFTMIGVGLPHELRKPNPRAGGWLRGSGAWRRWGPARGRR